MPKPTQTEEQQGDKEKSQHDRAPYQKNQDRDPVKSAEQTHDVPTKHGALK